MEGLQREQFELLVDGKPQNISFLEQITAGSRREASLVATSGATGPAPEKGKAAADVVLDFRYVSDAAAEIKKRSSRLRTNLVFPESAKTDKREKNPPTEGLKSQLVKLDRLIGSFVTNPVFTDANVINAELAAKARGDLDEIIELSDTVKKHAANLNKTNPKSH